MSKILLTGASGFLGKRLILQLAQTKHDVHPLSGNLDCDLLNYNQALARFSTINPDIVIHAAGKVGGIGLNNNQPADLMQQNLQMGLNVIQASHWVNVRKFILMGTICSYPRYPNHVPFKEEDLGKDWPDWSNRPYGMAKLTLMELLQAYKRQFAFDHTTIMCANLYGPGDNFKEDSSHVIPALIRKFIRAKNNNLSYVELMGNGSPTRDFLYVDDAASAIIKAIDSSVEDDVVNIGTGVETSIKSLAQSITKLVGYAGEVRWFNNGMDGQPRRVLDCSRAKRYLEWKSTTDLSTGLKQTIDWYRTNHYE